MMGAQGFVSDERVQSNLLSHRPQSAYPKSPRQMQRTGARMPHLKFLHALFIVGGLPCIRWLIGGVPVVFQNHLEELLGALRPGEIGHVGGARGLALGVELEPVAEKVESNWRDLTASFTHANNISI